MPRAHKLKAALLSLLLFALFLGVWQFATQAKESTSLAGASAEYAALMGKGAEKTDGFPPPAKVGRAFVEYLSDPFYDKGSQYTVPYTTYTTGIGYRTDKVSTTPWDLANPYEIYWDEANSGKTYLLDDGRGEATSR